jgi:hypothetical protein
VETVQNAAEVALAEFAVALALPRPSMVNDLRRLE